MVRKLASSAEHDKVDSISDATPPTGLQLEPTVHTRIFLSVFEFQLQMNQPVRGPALKLQQARQR